MNLDLKSLLDQLAKVPLRTKLAAALSALAVLAAISIGGYVAGDKVEVVVKRKDMTIKIEATLEAAKVEAPMGEPKPPFKLPMPRER